MSVGEAYAEAVRVTRREARNFAWGIVLLPRAKRLALAALYAFARRVDDIADDPLLEPGERRRRLEDLDR
ncbi:MAG: squalene/phytoene synthase family protein, partial [Thermoleophilia bacterium]|nr:squalene/phytoene synthase family protein [Thermoleophilia bacterium]